VQRQAQQQAPQPQQQQQAAAPLLAGRTPEQVDALTNQIVQAIAQHETQEQAVESTMRTSSGVRASYASQIQATGPWVLTALLALDDATLQNTFNLTRAELQSAENRANAAGQVWTAVMQSPQATTAVTFTAANQALVGQSGLTQADMTAMFQFRDLRSLVTTTIDQYIQANLAALNAQQVWNLATAAERQRAQDGVQNAAGLTADGLTRLRREIAIRNEMPGVAANPLATGLGIPVGSLNAYARGNWAEDRAAWQRVAIGREPPPAAGQPAGTVGQRVEAAATAGQGLTLGRARIGTIVRAYLGLPANAAATDEAACRHAAQRHNPGNAQYPGRVVAHFQRIQGVAITETCSEHGISPPAAAPAPAPAPAPAAAPIAEPAEGLGSQRYHAPAI
jgi:hypothetical protein